MEVPVDQGRVHEKRVRQSNLRVGDGSGVRGDTDSLVSKIIVEGWGYCRLTGYRDAVAGKNVIGDGDGAIGIDTSTDYTDGGKLVLKDETKLKDAIENNFDDFKKMFMGTSSKTLSTSQSYVGSSKYMEDGLFTRMSNILNDYVSTPGLGTDGTYTLAGSMNQFVNKQYDYSSTGYSGKNTLPDQIYKQTVSIANLKTQMSDAETRYYNKFSALESLMSTLSSQQSTLTSMLG